MTDFQTSREPETLGLDGDREMVQEAANSAELPQIVFDPSRQDDPRTFKVETRFESSLL